MLTEREIREYAEKGFEKLVFINERIYATYGFCSLSTKEVIFVLIEKASQEKQEIGPIPFNLAEMFVPLVSEMSFQMGTYSSLQTQTKKSS